MYTILNKKQLTDDNYLMEIEAPWIAQSGLPGQFVIVIPHEKGERIPLTICDINAERRSVTIVYQVVGDTTSKLSKMNAGEHLFTIVGPLGHASELCNITPDDAPQRHILFVAGGVGTAPVYPQAKWCHEHEISADIILGARNKS